MGMDKVEKAVIDLDGKWPDDDSDYTHMGEEPVLLVCLKSGDEEGGDGKYVKGQYYDGTRLFRKSDFDKICTKTEFMEARKRLENKPNWDYAPDWANALGQDSDGWWVFLEHFEPEDHDHEEWMVNLSDTGVYEKAQKGHVFGDWRQSLERRPESNPEPEWVPGVDLPPVGVDCEFLDSSGRWHHVTITAHALLGVCFVEKERDGENYTAKDARKFRAIKSHRDRAIEAAMQVGIARDGAFHLPADFCDALYDAGLLRLPEDKEGE